MSQLLDKTIKILQMKHIRGPNMWCWVEVVEAWIDIGDLEDYPSDQIPGFYDRLVQAMPSIIEHRCSYEERGGFLKRVEEGTWPVHIMEHLTLELQGLAGFEGGFGRARETNDRGIYKLIVASPHVQVTQQAIEDAKGLLLALIQDQPFDLKPVIDNLREMIDDLCLGPSTSCIVQAGHQQSIPMIRLSKGNLVQLGYGARQKRIWTAETSQTSAIAETISRDKDLTKTLLASVGLPVPEGQLVESGLQAWEVANEIGLPVVVKPQDGNHGRGVFTNLQFQDEILAAYEIAKNEGSGVLVEKFILGDEHRLLVVGDHLVAAAKGEACRVKGDGQHTILELIEIQINSDPRRGTTEDYPLNPVRIDSIALLELKGQGFEPSSIPAFNHEVLIQRNGNVAFDVTDLVHPSVAKRVVLAAKVVGLDIAGVDLVAMDISRPLEEQGAAIVEVNAGPGLLMHLKPAKGKPREVGEAIIRHLFPQEDNGRIPIIGVSGSRGADDVAQICAYFFNLANHYVGLSCKRGLFLNQKMVEASRTSEWDIGKRILLSPMVSAAVLETTGKSIINEGMSYDLCQISIVTNVDQTILFPEDSITEVRQLFSVYRSQVDVLLPGLGVAILNGEDELVVEMAEINPGAETIFYGLELSSPFVIEHIQKNGKSVQVKDNSILLMQGSQELERFDLQNSRYLKDQQNTNCLLNLMAGVGAAWASHLPMSTIEVGVNSFAQEEMEA
jgi:cyanophycin synthetase